MRARYRAQRALRRGSVDRTTLTRDGQVCADGGEGVVRRLLGCPEIEHGAEQLRLSGLEECFEQVCVLCGDFVAARCQPRRQAASRPDAIQRFGDLGVARFVRGSVERCILPSTVPPIRSRVACAAANRGRLVVPELSVAHYRLSL